jgi:hypothetical protein
LDLLAVFLSKQLMILHGWFAEVNCEVKSIVSILRVPWGYFLRAV